MATFDDINLPAASSETERPAPGAAPAERREVGPESEVRGGSEAPDDALDEDAEGSPSGDDAAAWDKI